MAVLDKGMRNVEILKQPEFSPMSVEKQVAIIYCGTKGLLRNVPVDKVKDFEELFLSTLEQKHADILEEFRKGKLNDDSLATVAELATTLAKQFKA